MEGCVVVAIEVHCGGVGETGFGAPAGSSTVKVDEELARSRVHVVGEAGLASICADVAALVVPDPGIPSRWGEGLSPSERLCRGQCCCRKEAQGCCQGSTHRVVDYAVLAPCGSQGEVLD